MPSHSLNQCWVIVNWNPSNKLQWNFNQNTTCFIHENASDNIVCEMAAISSTGRWIESKQQPPAAHYSRIMVLLSSYRTVISIIMICNFHNWETTDNQTDRPWIIYKFLCTVIAWIWTTIVCMLCCSWQFGDHTQLSDNEPHQEYISLCLHEFLNTMIAEQNLFICLLTLFPHAQISDKYHLI